MTFMLVLFLAMLIPVWIPVAAVSFGAVADTIQRRRGTHVQTGAAAVVAQLKVANLESAEAVAA